MMQHFKIPIRSKQEYMQNSLNKTEKFLARRRWKALFSLHKYVKSKETMENVNLKSGDPLLPLKNGPALKRICSV